MKKGVNTNKSDSLEIVLNDRQKEILVQMELPTDLDELSYSQKKAIIAIEEMLGYVEKKYESSFEYVGYIEKSSMEDEQLIAYKTGMNKSVDSFIVKKTEAGYEDNYLTVAIKSDFSEYLEKLISNECSIQKVRVYSEITKTSLENIPEADSEYKDSVSSSNCIFIYEEVTNENMISNVNSIKNVMNDNQLYGISQVIFLKEDILSSLTRYNYTDYLNPDYYEGIEEISIQR